MGFCQVNRNIFLYQVLARGVRIGLLVAGLSPAYPSHSWKTPLRRSFVTAFKLLLASLLALAIGLAGITLSSAGFESELDALRFVASDGGTNTMGTRAETVRLDGVMGNISNTSFGARVTAALTDTAPMTGSLKIVTAITKFFSGTVTAAEVIALHDAGWGYGEIFRLYKLAKESGKTIAEIQAMLDAGKGWGEIARALGLLPGNKGVNLGAAVSGRGISGTMTTTVGSGVKPKAGPEFTPPGLSKNDKGPDKDNRGPDRANDNPPGKGKGRR